MMEPFLTLAILLNPSFPLSPFSSLTVLGIKITMSFSKPNMSTLSFRSSADLGFGSNIDEGRWVAYIRRTLEEELEEDTQIPVSIFGVPKTLLLSAPDSYIPQEFSIGLYHHFRPELYDMEKYKLAAAQRYPREIPNKNLQYLVDQYLKFELKI